MKFLFSHIFYNFYLLIVTVIIHQNNGYKILGIFPVPAKSHFTCDNAIMKSLIEAGHDVTVITAFPEQASAENYTSIIDVSKNEFIYVSRSSINDFSTLSLNELLTVTAEHEIQHCHKVMNLPEIQKILNSEEKLYDVVFVEILCLYKCFLPVAAKMKVPVIGTVTTKVWSLADQTISNPNNPAFIPDIGGVWRLKNFHHRIRNTYSTLITGWFWHHNIIPMINQFHENYSHQLDSLADYKNIEPSLIFYNSHASLIPRPMNPNAIEIGGIHLRNAEPLPEHIQKFIDEAHHGVVLFTFGSVIRATTLPAETQQIFIEVFAELQQRVIWKFEEKMENVPNNVMLVPWLPQRDILEHKNVKVFISHCGQGGMNEAIYTGTPVIACPLFGDQPGNALLLEDKEVAVHLDINNISKKNVLQALNSIINDTRYYQNMQQLSKIFKDRPFTPQQSVVYWTEYVIKHNGAPHLQTAAIQLKWYQYLLLDVLCVVLLCFVLVAFSTYKLVKILYRYLMEIRRKCKIYKNKSI